MMWLGLLITVAFVPGWTGAAIPTGWAAMSVTLPWFLWRRVDMTLFHWLGLAFVAWAFVTLAWAPRADDAVLDLWHVVLLAMAFGVGFRLRSLRGLWRGMAIGVTISSVLAVVQCVGWNWFDHWLILPLSDWSKPSGLFYNGAVAGAVAAVVLTGLLSEFDFLWTLGVLPTLYLAHSRGAWVAVAGTYAATLLVQLRGKDRVICLSALVIAGVVVWHLFFGWPSDGVRLTVWKAFASHLTLLGSGAGSSQTLYLLGPQVFHVEHAHNDYLQLAFEYGLGALPLAILAWLLAENLEAAEWPALACLLILGTYFWILFTPATLFVLGVVAGRLAADLSVAWDHGHSRGLGSLLRSARAGCKAVPVVVGH